MADEHNDTTSGTTTYQRITIRPYVPPTPEQLARRRELADEADRIRAEIGRIEIRADDLIHQARAEAGE